MNSPVHISVKNKINIPLITDSHNLDIVLISGISEIPILQLPEAEYPIYFAAPRSIGPQVSLLCKSNYCAAVI